MNIFLSVIELWKVQECLGEKINQRGITRKLRKGKQLFLCLSCHLDLMHIPIKLHDDIPNGYWYKNVSKKINQRDITQKLRKGEQSFLCVTHCLDLIHIPIHV